MKVDRRVPVDVLFRTNKVGFYGDEDNEKKVRPRSVRVLDYEEAVVLFDQEIQEDRALTIARMERFKKQLKRLQKRGTV